MLNVIYYFFCVLFSIATLGGLAYYLLAIDSVRRRRRRNAEGNPISFPPISLLKPLCGADPDLKSHLESFFRQDYPAFEILFAVRNERDPALLVVCELMQKYPQISTQIVLTGEPPYANAKVYSMEKMAALAQHEILVITDSDASVSSDYLQDMARSFAPENVGAVTNLYRGVSGSDFWSKLEALGMSTEFMAGVVVAERLEGMHFTLGPSMAVRAKSLTTIGSFARMADYLADDFVLGQWVAEAGERVVLSTHIINHHASATGFMKSFKHRVRWNRSSRYSRPAGYFGQGFTYGSTWATALFLFAPSWLTAAILVLIFVVRFWLASELGTRLLEDSFVIKRSWMIPLQDWLSAASWCGGLMGREILWRNERYRLLDDGRFVPVIARDLNTEG